MSLPIYNISLMNEVIVTVVFKYQTSTCYFNFHYAALPSKAEHFRNTKSSYFVRQYFYHNICKSIKVIRHDIIVCFQQASTPVTEAMSAVCCC